MSGWFVCVEGREAGPLETNVLVAYLTCRDPSEVYVWRDGFDDWRLASTVTELAISPPPPPPLIGLKREISIDLPRNNHDRANAGNTDFESPERLSKSGRKNLIARHWRGELPLWVSYWLIGFLGSIALIITIAWLQVWLGTDNSYNPLRFFFLIITTWTCVIVIGVWQLVGTWRSAVAYSEARRRENRPVYWAGLAHVMLALGAFGNVSGILKNGVPQVYEASRMAFENDPTIPNYSIRLMRGGTEVEIVGGIKFGLTDDLIKILDASRQVKVVHLDSVGGRLGEGEKLFNLIRNRSLSTYVSSKCLSACTLAFAGGRERFLHRGAILGFHEGSFPGIEDADNAIQREVFGQAGFDKGFIDKAMSTPPTSIWKPTSDMLLSSKVVTSITDGNRFAYSGLGSDLSKEDIARKFATASPLFDAIKVRFPDQYKLMVDELYDDVQNGRTEQETIARVRTKTVPFIRRLLPLADDDVLVDYDRLLVDQYAELNKKSATSCYLYASGADPNINVFSLFPSVLKQRELMLEERVVRTAARRTVDDKAVVEALWNKVRDGMTVDGITANDFEFFQSAKVESPQYARYCHLAIAMFREIGRLPAHETVMLMRDVLK